MLSQQRSAFSFVEVLVTLAIIAVLSAILIPTLAGKVRESDANRIVVDLTTLQTAIKAFVTDVHRFPGKVDQLSKNISGSSKDIDGVLYPSNLVGNWRGPYLIRDMTDVMNQVDLDPSFKPTTGDNGLKYATIQLNGVQKGEFSNIELILDAGNQIANSSTTGFVTYSGTTLKFLAVPITL